MLAAHLFSVVAHEALHFRIFFTQAPLAAAPHLLQTHVPHFITPFPAPHFARKTPHLFVARPRNLPELPAGLAPYQPAESVPVIEHTATTFVVEFCEPVYVVMEK